MQIATDNIVKLVMDPTEKIDGEYVNVLKAFRIQTSLQAF